MKMNKNIGITGGLTIGHLIGQSVVVAPAAVK